VIAGVQLRALRTNKGALDPKEVESKIRKTEQDIHYPSTSLIILENAHSNGRVIPLDNMEEIYNIAKKHNISVHLDGARIFNAATHLKVEPKEIAKYCDSVMFCLSKGLLCPVGSLVCGTKKFIDLAKSKRKLMGGGLRQVGMLAAPGIIALNEIVPQLADDHRIALLLAAELSKFDWVKVYAEDVHINMVYFEITNDKIIAANLVKALREKGIKINPPRPVKLRFTTHHYIREKEVETVINTMKEFFISNSIVQDYLESKWI